jgi:hypothetical protein
MAEKEYDAWREVVASCAAKDDGSRESDFCAEILMAVDALEEICGDIRNDITRQAVDIAIRCITGGPVTTVAIGHLVDAIEEGKAVLVTEPALLGPVAGHA